MNKEYKEKWVEALRSGEYKQGTRYLKHGDEYCCLGVLCDTVDPDNAMDWKDRRDLPVEMQHKVGLSATGIVTMHNGNDGNTYSSTLAYLNDWDEYTFEEIADVIEKEL
jgi:hypothetical protein